MALPFAHDRLEKKLLAGGRPAVAEVLGSEPTKRTLENGAPLQLVTRRWRLSLRVGSVGAERFDVDITQPVPGWLLPWRGDTLDVLYDADDHSSVVVDPRAELPPPPPEWMWNAQWTGTSPAHVRRAQLEVQSAQPEHRDDLELLTGFYADYSLYDFEYDELRRRILGLPMPADPRAGIAKALGLTPEEAARTTMRGRDNQEIPLAPSREEGQIASLQKLAALRDSGALSEAEFEAAKRKQLGGGAAPD